MKIDGRCHCGFIAYAAEVDPAKVEVCHCTDCQTLSGSAFRIVVPAEDGSFRLLSGEPKTYVKTAESGNRRIQAFCPQCGTSVYSTAVNDGPPRYGLRVGTIRQRRELVPRMQYWARSALPWIAGLTSLPRVGKE